MSVSLARKSKNAARCPACGSPAVNAEPAWEFSSHRGRTEWQRCRDCHSYFMDEQYAAVDEAEHASQMAYGDAVAGRQINDFKRRLYRSILDHLRSHIDIRGKKLLDVGCSYGGFMTAAIESGVDAYGIDIVPDAVDQCCRAGLKVQCCSQVQQCDLIADKFDIVSVLDMHMYWPDQPEELAAILNCLKPGGLVIMRVVSKSWMATIGRALQKVSSTQGEKVLRRAVNDHRFSMPLASLLKLVEKTGFEVVTATASGAVHSDHTSLPVKMSFALGNVLQKTLGVLLVPGAVVIARRPV